MCVRPAEKIPDYRPELYCKISYWMAFRKVTQKRSQNRSESFSISTWDFRKTLRNYSLKTAEPLILVSPSKWDSPHAAGRKQCMLEKGNTASGFWKCGNLHVENRFYGLQMIQFEWPRGLLAFAFLQCVQSLQKGSQMGSKGVQDPGASELDNFAVHETYSWKIISHLFNNTHAAFPFFCIHWKEHSTWDHKRYDPGAFKLDHLQPIKPVSQK